MVINELFKDYIKRYESEIKELEIKKPEDYFMQEYYDYICESIKSGNKITQNVYDNIPDLHYWIEHTFIIHGYNVVA